MRFGHVKAVIAATMCTQSSFEPCAASMPLGGNNTGTSYCQVVRDSWMKLLRSNRPETTRKDPTASR